MNFKNYKGCIVLTEETVRRMFNIPEKVSIQLYFDEREPRDREFFVMLRTTNSEQGLPEVDESTYIPDVSPNLFTLRGLTCEKCKNLDCPSRGDSFNINGKCCRQTVVGDY